MGVRRQDERTLAGGEQGFAMPCRNGKPPFRIQIECCSPLEHPSSRSPFTHFSTRLPTLKQQTPSVNSGITIFFLHNKDLDDLPNAEFEKFFPLKSTQGNGHLK